MIADRSDQSGKTRDEGEPEPVVVRDRRRIDPETGQRRVPDANGAERMTESMSGTLDEELAKVADGAAEEASSGVEQQVEALTADLKRVTAEYANYRKRVDRDRDAVVASAKASVATELLTVLDDIERAETHGDLTGAFKAVADKLIEALKKAGLESFGEEGDEFDPSVHEAVQHATSPDVSGPTVTMVMRRGYRFGDRVLRPAMVGVTDHEPAEFASTTESATDEQPTEQD